jgi:hypothetical protein
MSDLGDAAFAAAVRPPQLSIKGRTYTGRILSLEQFAPFEPYLTRMSDPTSPMGASQIAAFVAVYLRTVFPWQARYLWQGDPVTHLRALPWGELLEVLQGFFAAQVASMAPTLPTNGRTSARSTAPSSAVA